MTESHLQSHAVIVLPQVMHGRVRRPALRKWLSKGRLSSEDPAEETLARVLRAIGHPVPADGFAALRYWGQSGERSGAWMAAADPVHLEARLDRLCLYAFHGDDPSRTELDELYGQLEEFLGDDDRLTLARQGPFAYLCGDESIATADVSPDVIDGRAPDDFMPSGTTAAVHDRLLGEFQLALHDHAVNRRRAAKGLRTVNSIWFWGGGTAPERRARPVAPLFADDPLFRGYWASCDGAIHSWTEDFGEILELAHGGFVAVAPRDIEMTRPEALSECLERLRRLVGRGGIRELTLLFRDGLGIDIGTLDAYRFWRKVSPIFAETGDDD